MPIFHSIFFDGTSVPVLLFLSYVPIKNESTISTPLICLYFCICFYSRFPPYSNAGFAFFAEYQIKDDCMEDGKTCTNGACLDSLCHCNDGFGGCNCQIPGEFLFMSQEFFQLVFFSLF